MSARYFRLGVADDRATRPRSVPDSNADVGTVLDEVVAIVHAAVDRGRPGR